MRTTPNGRCGPALPASPQLVALSFEPASGSPPGWVVVGDLIGEGSAHEQSVVGETPNLAAPLQALAEPDTVVIPAGTRRLLGDLFEYRDLGEVEIKGIAAGRWRLGRYCDRAPSRAASRRCAARR